jgi:hypothetical protein
MSLLPPLPGALVLLHPTCLSCRLVSYRIPQHGVAQVNLLAHALKPAASSSSSSAGSSSSSSGGRASTTERAARATIERACHATGQWRCGADSYDVP